MHIVLVNRWYPPGSGFGGVATYNSALARALVRLGHRVTVIGARWDSSVPRVENDEGVAVHRLLVRNRWRLHRIPVAGRYMRAFLQLCYSLRVAWMLHRLESRDRPDVIEFADVEAEGFAYLFRRRRCPVSIRCHTPTFVWRRYYTDEETPYDKRITGAMEKFCIRRADLITAPSRDMARVIARECGIPEAAIRVIPNALEVETFDVQRERPENEARDDVVVLHVGRLERAKGIDVLARAIPDALRSFPHLRFVFIGNDSPDPAGGSPRARLESVFGEEQVQDRVRFLGAVDEAELRAWYRRADLAVVPSLLYESFSYTCAQAMAAGLPVIASRIGGIPETVEDGVSGLLVEPGDSSALARAIGRLAADRELRRSLGEAAQARAHSLFAAPVIARQMLAQWPRVSGPAADGELAPRTLSQSCR